MYFMILSLGYRGQTNKFAEIINMRKSLYVHNLPQGFHSSDAVHIKIEYQRMQ